MYICKEEKALHDLMADKALLRSMFTDEEWAHFVKYRGIDKLYFVTETRCRPLKDLIDER